MVGAAEPVQVETGPDAGDHPGHVGLQFLGGAGIEEEHGVGHMAGGGPPLLDDAVDLGRPLRQRPHHLVPHVAGSGLELGPTPATGCRASGDPLAVVEALRPVDQCHGQHPG